MVQISAEQNLTLADEYLTRASNSAKPGTTSIAEWGRDLKNIQTAIDYLAEARRLDPNANLKITDSKSGEVRLRSQDALAVEALYLTGLFKSLADLDKKTWNEGLEALTKALKYSPTDARLYRQIGMINVRLNQRDEALANFNKALEYDPMSSDIRDILSELKGDSQIGIPPSWIDEQWVNICRVALPCLVVGILLLFTRLSFLGVLLLAAYGAFYFLDKQRTKKLKFSLTAKAISGRAPGEFSR